ncbi:MAG: hypothetical protein ACREAK_10995 [Nitrosarchaeum sp.]
MNQPKRRIVAKSMFNVCSNFIIYIVLPSFMKGIMLVIFFGLGIISLFMVNVSFADNDVLPPIKQIRHEKIFPYDVICKEGLELIFKIQTANPSCVTDSTADKLAKRGWIKPEPVDVQFFTEKNEYIRGEPIKITMKNLGQSTLWQLTSVSISVGIVDENNEVVTILGGGDWQGGSIKFNPGDEVSYTWDQMNQKESTNRFAVEPGKYMIKSELRYYTGPYMPSKTISILNYTEQK